MAMAFEMLGISPMGSSMVPAEDGQEGRGGARTCGRLVLDVLERDLRPQLDHHHATRCENAIAGVAMTGGSTNAVLHLLAVASEAGVELSIDDFDRIAWQTPLLADLKPVRPLRGARPLARRRRAARRRAARRGGAAARATRSP